MYSNNSYNGIKNLNGNGMNKPQETSNSLTQKDPDEINKTT